MEQEAIWKAGVHCKPLFSTMNLVSWLVIIVKDAHWWIIFLSWNSEDIPVCVCVCVCVSTIWHHCCWFYLLFLVLTGLHVAAFWVGIQRRGLWRSFGTCSPISWLSPLSSWWATLTWLCWPNSENRLQRPPRSCWKVGYRKSCSQCLVYFAMLQTLTDNI